MHEQFWRHEKQCVAKIKVVYQSVVQLSKQAIASLVHENVDHAHLQVATTYAWTEEIVRVRCEYCITGDQRISY
jgi:hypothetical protein